MLRSVLRGYYQYHAVPGNPSILSRFRYHVVRLWYRTLCQRSQRRPTWKKLGPIFDHWLPIPRLVHDYPDARFDARRLATSHPR
jgi:RNA-directed DNA polymerase